MRLIDADELRLTIQREYNTDDSDYPTHYQFGLHFAMNAIDEAPTVEPQRKTGKWIDTTQGDHYKCSCCGTRAAFWFNEENSSGWERDMSEWLSDFCPNCGADMRKQEEQGCG